MSRPNKKRTRLDAFLSQVQEDIDEPEVVDDYVEDLEDSDDDGGEYMPSSPEVHELEDAADDDPASPKMATSKKFTARTETRNKRNQKKLDMQEAKERAKKVTEEIRAKKSAKTTGASGIRSPLPSRPETPASHESDEFSPKPQSSRGSTRKKKFCLEPFDQR